MQGSVSRTVYYLCQCPYLMKRGQDTLRLYLPSIAKWFWRRIRRPTYGFIYIFSLCRAIRLAKRIDRSILKSIVTPSTGLPRQSQLIKEIVALSKDLIPRYFPSLISTPLTQGVRTLGENLESETFVEAVKVKAWRNLLPYHLRHEIVWFVHP